MKWKERLQADIRLVGIGLLIAGVLIWFLYTRIGYWIILAFVVFLALILFLPPLWNRLVEKIRRCRKTREFEKKLEAELKEALKIMDSIRSPYRSEHEANKELVCILRAKGVNAIYQPSEEGVRPDIKVGNIFIECKLDLVAQKEANTLIGQALNYSDTSGCRIAIIIYGQFREEFKTTIQKRLPGSPIIYLPNPRRVGAEPSRERIVGIRRLD